MYSIRKTTTIGFEKITKPNENIAVSIHRGKIANYKFVADMDDLIVCISGNFDLIFILAVGNSGCYLNRRQHQKSIFLGLITLNYNQNWKYFFIYANPYYFLGFQKLSRSFDSEMSLVLNLWHVGSNFTANNP
jgi:hypothetical protein